MDKDLLVLKEFSDVQLLYLFDTMKKQAFFTCILKDDIKEDIHAHVEEIAEELCRFGGNTFANVYRGKGVSYVEVLRYVVSYVGQSHVVCDDVKTLEEFLLNVFFEKSWRKMEIKNWDETNAKTKKEILDGSWQKILKDITKDKVKKIVERTIISSRPIFIDQIGLYPSLYSAVKMITGPAMRVLLPCVLFIAGTRQSLGGNKL